MTTNLRKQLIRLAHAKPELRPKLLPLIRQAAAEENDSGDAEVSRVLTKVEKELKKIDPKAKMKDLSIYADGGNVIIDGIPKGKMRSGEDDPGVLEGLEKALADWDAKITKGFIKIPIKSIK